MKKIYCMIAQVVLLLWFFLDMTGLYFGDKCLVTRSYKEDGIFFLIYLAALILFFTKEKLGKWLVIGWMSMWFVIQFMCHEWYSIFNGGFMGTLEGKILSVTSGLKLKRIVATTDYMLADRFGRIELMSRHRSHYLWIFNPLLPA